MRVVESAVSPQEARLLFRGIVKHLQGRVEAAKSNIRFCLREYSDVDSPVQEYWKGVLYGEEHEAL